MNDVTNTTYRYIIQPYWNVKRQLGQGQKPRGLTIPHSLQPHMYLTRTYAQKPTIMCVMGMLWAFTCNATSILVHTIIGKT